MWLVEPADNEITRPENYWWWFLVTASTVGYGDFFPESAAGHVVGGYVIIGGIVTLTILFTQLATVLQTAKGRRMKGSVGLAVSGRTVLLGYTAGRTVRVVAEPERSGVQFVRGVLTHADVMNRACVPEATTVSSTVGTTTRRSRSLSPSTTPTPACTWWRRFAT